MPRPKKPASPFRYFNSSPEAITTDGLRSYKAAMSELSNAWRQEIGLFANNRVANSHLSIRSREKAMQSVIWELAALGQNFAV